MPSAASLAHVDALDALYRESVANLRTALSAYIATGTRPDPAMRAGGAFCYPELRVRYDGARPVVGYGRAFARLNEPGDYAVSVTQPGLFRTYIAEQLDFLVEDFGAVVTIGRSAEEIPYPYVLDAEIDLTGAAAVELARIFPSTDLAHIGDEIADGIAPLVPGRPRPLALFDAARVDFSLARLRHYTGTPPAHVQKYILFTNYHRYVDEFVRWACAELNGDKGYTLLSGAGGVEIRPGDTDVEAAIADSAWRRHQMPAYHLVAPDGGGITLVNIGVGPSNAKTITDHLAVTRPEAWLMIGHCGGLRPSQRIGDYVLAHAYLRDDHVLDDVLPPEIPIPAIAEVQVALGRAAERVSGESGEQLKRRLRTGTVVTSDDRNWELRYTRSALRFSQSRAVAIDMESATLAAQGYRFRVPYGTLLCVSDKPIHGEIKLPGQANRFYERAIAEHLQIGIAAIDELKLAGEQLHSRKLRAFNEPPFR
ncbi:AMP nucleosidase [Sphingomonas nostoxanthinifaciens]|uniref:AMP nucleosidase n=1 Tax=Sphingomonas nostoxanthinifaciens TaxID=2872652 RepID=UPI001CC204FB|nr:AMP nucleosidase [Sphingomonas nostoxanthinifaciens]UAK23550.1 AMP nucleosidase [Sphingomonas nostoxanthinifaciens]